MAAAAHPSLSLTRRTAAGVTTDLLQALLTAASARVPVALAPAAAPEQTSELRLVIGGDSASALTGVASIARYVSSIGQNHHLLPTDANALKVRGKIDQMLDFTESTLAPQVNASNAGLLQSLQYLDAVLFANTHAHGDGKKAPVVLSLTGAHHVTVADIAIFAALFPLLSPAGAAALSALTPNAASFARVSAWFERLRTFELKDSLHHAFAAATAAGAHTAAPAAAAGDKKQQQQQQQQKADQKSATEKVVLIAGGREARAFQPVAAINPNDVFDIAWAPRVPVGHTEFSWRRSLGAAITAATRAPASAAAAGAAAAAAPAAAAGDAAAAEGGDAAAEKKGKRAEKTAAKAAAFKEKEAAKAKRAEEEAKKKEAAAAAGDKKEAKSKGRIKPKAGDSAAAAAGAGAGADAQTKTPEDPALRTGFVGASQPPKREVLPIPGARNILITSALPYVNNVPHLGNIIGCVLSADVYARFCRLRGHNTLYVCGTDEYGTATETKAILDKVTPKELCDRFHVIHRDIYQWFNIGFDQFGRTTTPQQTAIAQDIFKRCDENKLVSQDSVVQLYCESCKRFLADRFIEGTCPKAGCGYEDARGDQCDKCGSLLNAEELIKPKCKLCSTPPVKRSSRHLFLDLNKLSGELETFVTKSSVAGAWSSNSTQVTKTWLRDGLNPRCISRDLKWGTPVPKPGFEDKVFYVWFDAPIGYISITANYTNKWEQWWKNQKDVQLYQFMGKDNIPFHTVIFPSTLLATRQPYTMLHHISTCEYLNYESGKFSKSRGTGVFGDDAVKSGIPSEVWRYYLLASRPESSDSTFLWDQFTAANNNELLASLGNYVQRSLTFVKSSFGGVVPQRAGTPTAVDDKFVADVNEQTALYVKQLEAVQIKEALKTVMKIAAIGNTYTQHTQPWVLFKSKSEADKHRCQTIVCNTVHAIRWLAVLVEPFMPTVSHKICQQLNTKLSAGVLRDPKAGAVVFDTNAFAAGHAIGEAVPIFREIKSDERDALKARFQGKQDVKEVSAQPFPLTTVVGVVKAAAAHEKPGLTVLHVDVGEADTRLCVSALAASYPQPAALVGRRVVVLTNIKPAGTPKVTGALLCADAKDAKDHSKSVRVLLTPADATAAAGTRVAPKGVKLVAQPNFPFKTALPSLALSVDANGNALYGLIAIEANGQPVVADLKVVTTSVSI